VRVKLDENVPVNAASIFAAAGHDVDAVADEGLAGCVAVFRDGSLRVRRPTGN